MPLLKTTETNDHSHVLFINEASPEMSMHTTTTNDGHVHDIMLDEQGMLSIVPAVNHTHEITPLMQQEELIPTIAESDKDAVNECWGLYKEAMECEGDSFKDGKESEEFKCGKQWNDSDKAKLKAEQRACLTINEIAPKLDLLSGYQRQNRTDIKYLPVEGGDNQLADVLNYVSKNITEQCNYEYEETIAFEDQIAIGRGALIVEIDNSKNINGDVVISARRWDEVLWGYHDKLDASDADYCIIKSKVSLSKLKTMYPDKAKAIQNDYSEMLMLSKGTHVEHPSRQYDLSDNKTPAEDIYNFDINSDDFVDIARKNYTLIRIYRKEYRKVPVAFNEDMDINVSLDGEDSKIIASVKTIPGFNVIYVSQYKILVRELAGRTLLDSFYSKFSDINVIPLYAKKNREKFWGKVQEAKDAQIELNKRHSQMIDIVNKMASYGIGYDSETFDNPADEESFKVNRMKAGFIQKFKPGFQQHLHEFQGVKFPSEVVNSAELSSQKINILMNVYPEMLGGSSSANQSGVVVNQKVRGGMIGNEYLFDNLSLSKKKIGRLIIEAIQLIYTPERIMRVVEKFDKKSKVELNGTKLFPEYTQEQLVGTAIQLGLISQEQAQQGQIDPSVLEQAKNALYDEKRAILMSMLDNFDAKKYDVVVSESTHTPTAMMSNYMILQELFRGNPNAPMGELIKLIPFLSEDIKNSMAQSMQAQAQAAQQESQMKYQTEIDKSMIAAESKGAAKQ